MSRRRSRRGTEHIAEHRDLIWETSGFFSSSEIGSAQIASLAVPMI
jgi:hypothetical protein